MSYYRTLLIQSGITTDGLQVWLETSNTNSYPGSGTIWTDLTVGENGTLNGTDSSRIAYSVDPTIGGIFTVGGNGLVTLGNNLAISTQSFTFSMWVRWTTVFGALQTFFGKSADTALSYTFVFNPTTREIIFRSWNVGNVLVETKTTTNSITQNQWMNITVKRDGTAVTIYVNAINRNSVNGTHNAFQSNVLSRDFIIFRNPSAGQNYLGQAEQFLYYNRALSDDEILSNFNARKSKFGY